MASVPGEPVTPGALTGLLIVELGEFVSAPHAAKMFADFGAHVVKVEHPAGGDPLRWRGPYPADHEPNELGGQFEYFNTNKDSAAWDLTNSDQRAHFDSLLGHADALITNLPIERLEALNLAPATVRAQYPKLIMTTITPFGLTGPYSKMHGDELITYAMSGLAHVSPGMPDTAEDPEVESPLHPATPVSEITAGVFGAIATLFAILQRDRTGEGAHIDLSQQEATTCVEARGLPAYTYGGMLPGRIPPIGKMPNFYLPCKDGYVVVATFLDHQWKKMVQVMGSPDWADTDTFADAQGRTQNWEPLKILIEEWLQDLTCDEVMQIGLDNHLPLFPTYSVRMVANSPHIKERGSLAEVNRGDYSFKIPGPPTQPRGTPWALRHPAPRLGENTEAIERENG